MAKPTQVAEIATRGDIVSVKTVDKVWRDLDGVPHHKNFVEIRLLVPLEKESVTAITGLYAKHELCEFGFSLIQGELTLIDQLAVTKNDVAAAKRDSRAA